MLAIHSFNEHPLNVLLEIWIDRISKDRQFPQLLVSPDIPYLDIVTAAIITRRDVTNTFVDYRIYLGWCETLGRSLFGQEQRKQKNQKSRTSNTDHRDVRSQISVSVKRVCYGRALINDPWNGITT
jgi:hypothetical protein